YIILKPIIFFEDISYTSKSKETLKKIKKYISDKNIDVEIIKTGSIGLTNLSPLISIQLPGKTRVFFKNISSENLYLLFDAVFNNFIPKQDALCQLKNNFQEPWEEIPFIDELDFFSSQKRNVLENCGYINPENIGEYIAFNGYKSFIKSLKYYSPEEVCKIIEKSELKGRISNISTGEKWFKVLKNNSEEKYFICNANETSLSGFSNKILIESNPHKLIESIAIASYAINCNKAFIFIPQNNSLAIKRIENAISQAKDLGLLGKNILNENFDLDIEIFKSKAKYICNEETALIQKIQSNKAIPYTTPPYPSEKGLNNKPTLINDIETLFNIPLIIKNGPEWFKSRSTKIFTVSKSNNDKVLIEVPDNSNFKKIFKIYNNISNIGNYKAALVGAPFGGFITKETEETKIDFESLKSSNINLGSNQINILDDNVCIVNLVKDIIDFLNKENCGKCSSCREGLKQLYEILKSITQRPKNNTGNEALYRFKGATQLEKLSKIIEQTSLCYIGKNATNIINSSLEIFREEYEEHIFERKCRAGVCNQLRKFFIDVDKCNGCNLCAKRCPENAIIGTVKSPHFIIEDKCTGCGICYEACKFGAIIIK
ncbi:MAG: 4Fe-4S binding protein, partial [Bacteroidales bacterium]|nr:4Fe-4S binding protein [Bacteroidales bacterium]